GRYDWLPVAGIGALIVVALTAGLLAFERRDIGRTIPLPMLRRPGFLVGLRSPLDRTFGERLRASTVWGVALGLYVLLIASTASSLAAVFHQVPTLEQV